MISQFKKWWGDDQPLRTKGASLVTEYGAIGAGPRAGPLSPPPTNLSARRSAGGPPSFGMTLLLASFLMKDNLHACVRFSSDLICVFALLVYAVRLSVSITHPGI